jgi:gamma-butyrobetaine dioxygenase
MFDCFVPDLTPAYRHGRSGIPHTTKRYLHNSTDYAAKPVDFQELDADQLVPRAVTDTVVDPLPLWLEDPMWLRDACTCKLCIDVSSKQKLFQTSNIPLNIKTRSNRILPDGTLQVDWLYDIPGFGNDHVSHYSKEFLEAYQSSDPMEKPRITHQVTAHRPPIFWNQKVIGNSLKAIDFEEYMSEDSVLFDVVEQLRVFGLVFIRGVPPSSTAVEDIGRRIGPLKNTFYGLTWDVKSVPQAKNVAYTHQFLGFHMDLLYVADPPGLQLLHCIKNSCEGGSSMFSDSFHAATELRAKDPELYQLLTEESAFFHYENAGEHYERRRKIIVDEPNSGEASVLQFVNWSPPFQGPFPVGNGHLTGDSIFRFRKLFTALKSFADHIDDPQNIYESRLQEGECVIFNNRRILHARRAFDISSGERWLKGAYIDTDAFLSRYQVLSKIQNSGRQSQEQSNTSITEETRSTHTTP